MLYLSKSKYCSLCQCPKILWLNKHKPEEAQIDPQSQSRMEEGNEVGDLAMGLFGDFVEVTTLTSDKLDLSIMIEKTKEEMKKGTPVICEASFSYNGLYCAVDILKKEEDGWAIYEVKSSSTDKNDEEVKDVYIKDISYQKYVLEQCGIKVVGTYLVQINTNYVFDGTLDIQNLFLIKDVSKQVSNEIKNVPTNLTIAEKYLNSENEPDIDLSEICKKPYHCGFWKYCSKHIPNPSVFDLYRFPFTKKIEYYKKGIISYQDLWNCSEITNDIRLRQIEYALEDKGTYIDKENIQNFLSNLHYPLYFLDFETIQPVIPKYVGTKPYAQIPFQYSLHYIESEGSELKHKEFLAESGIDPRRPLAEQLCADIPINACVIAYNKNFECTRIKELADTFPDLANHLLMVQDNIVDLLEPFQKGYYYNKAMGGSFSIKSVLPAIFPDDPTLDYHNLEGVHNGGEAMTIFPQIQYMEPDQAKKARENLLKYCELDTYATVKVWEELVKVTKQAT